MCFCGDTECPSCGERQGTIDVLGNVITDLRLALIKYRLTMPEDLYQTLDFATARLEDIRDG